MTPLHQHAVALARTGYWRLLDSLELVDRSRVEPTLAGMLHATGSTPVLGYANDEDDDHYEYWGVGLSLGDCEHWRTLNGEPLENEPRRNGSGAWLSVGDAEAMVKEYARLVAALGGRP